MKIKISFGFLFVILCSLLLVLASSNVYCPISTEPAIEKVPLDPISLSEKLGQNLIVGIPYKELDAQSEAILREIKPAGIVLYQRNFENFDQVTLLIKKLQKISQETSQKPYFIMLDEEPDGANRMGLLKDIFPLGNPNWMKIEKDIQILSSIGINIELAPLADFPFLPNSFIAKRIPFKTPENLKAFNQTFIHLLQKNHVFATLKHFPGLGLFSDDPHHQFIQTQSDEEIVKKSMVLFKDGITSGTKFVMTSHAQYDKLDPANPATFSKILVTEYLVNQLGFKGIITTDDLSDMPLSIEGLNLVDAGESALEAGHNLIMFSHQLPKTKSIFNELLQRVKQEKELQKIVERNYEKIITFKVQFLQKPWFIK
jgi:beta-N-acetylhexosaminidase